MHTSRSDTSKHESHYIRFRFHGLQDASGLEFVAAAAKSQFLLSTPYSPGSTYLTQHQREVLLSEREISTASFSALKTKPLSDVSSLLRENCLCQQHLLLRTTAQGKRSNAKQRTLMESLAKVRETHWFQL